MRLPVPHDIQRAARTRLHAACTAAADYLHDLINELDALGPDVEAEDFSENDNLDEPRQVAI